MESNFHNITGERWLWENMIMLLRKACAFVQRDFRIESGYKSSFVMSIFQSLSLVVFLYFFGKLIAPHSSPALSRFGGRYFPFAIIGLAFARYFDLTLKLFSESIRTAQMTGCLEAMLMSSLYALISGAVQLLLILVAGALAFGVDLRGMNIPATLLVLVLSVATFVACGVLSAATVVRLKKGDPFTWMLGGFGSLLGGAYFPIDVMPAWMQKVSSVIPITYSLDALRLTMLKGYSVNLVAKPVVTLTAIAVILLPASIALFVAAVRNGRKEGTLMQY
jgi:ABC-2 type transport system permease protein